MPDDSFHYEVIDGVLYVSPAPRPKHQAVSGNLFLALANHIRSRGLGWLYHAPIGVRLPGQPVPIQPDLVFVSEERESIIGEENIEGVPDLIIEILSPSNWLFDRRDKFQLYESTGVGEYWIVDYRARKVEIFVLEKGAFTLLGEWREGEIAHSRVLPGFSIAVDDVFEH
ncbi:MAG: Uma2 family endonuclease [Anaerolineales bacterium]